MADKKDEKPVTPIPPATHVPHLGTPLPQPGPLTVATPPPVVTPPVVPPVSHAPSPQRVSEIVDKNVSDKAQKKKELLELMGAAIKEYGGEGNIPIDHEYWAARNEYRRE